mmetsp:Transcript_66911/g.93080  ORF Transcript_66911/g.93080 Transcript_66911/m.93080 type:complete len:427 (+) Transcript_66911:145-1425(+)
MWADIDGDALAFPDLGAGSDPLSFLDIDPKVAGPMTDSIDSMLEDFLGSFSSDHHHHAGQAEECLVCYDPLSTTHGHHRCFARCGHGSMLCNNCADKLHRCPMCREIKEGSESYVLATEALQEGRSCDEQFGDSRATSFFLPDGEENGAPSCSAAPLPDPFPSPAQSSPDANSELMEAEVDAFLEEALSGQTQTAGWPQQENQQEHQHAEQLHQPTEQFGAPAPTENEPVPMDEEPTQSARGSSGRPRRQNAGSRRRTTSPAPKAARKQTQQRPKIKRSNTVSKDPDNPFAQHGVPDDDVELVTFKEFQALMKRLNLSSEEVAAGKRFRKRLKNRRQVMMYADKQRVNTASLKVQNNQLMEQVQMLTQENEELKERNHFLEQTLEYLEQARTDAVNECSQLQQQMLELTTQMNELGFFDDHMVSLE